MMVETKDGGGGSPLAVGVTAEHHNRCHDGAVTSGIVGAHTNSRPQPVV